MPENYDKLPPDPAVAQAAQAARELEEKQVTPPVEDASKGQTATEEERQSTREWLRSLGVVAGEVATREAPRIEREQERREAPPERSTGVRDTDEVLNLLREGDDARFVEGVVDLSRKRVFTELQRTERDAAFGQQVNKFVNINAPDVPLVVFWSFAERAERMYPTEVDKQIDWAISAGRAAMENHNAMVAERGQSIRRNLDASETLDGTPTRQRRRGGREAEPKVTSFVEELLAERAKYE